MKNKCMYVLIILGHEIPFRTTLFPAWFIYFIIGIYVRNNNITSLIKHKYIAIVIGLLLSVIEGIIIDKYLNNYSFASSQIKISSCIYSIAIINLITNINSKCKLHRENIVSRIGNNSYGIFYSHMIFLTLCTIVLNKLCIVNNLLPIYQLIQMITSLFLSYIFVKVIKKLLGTKSYLIGD